MNFRHYKKTNLLSGYYRLISMGLPFCFVCFHNLGFFGLLLFISTARSSRRTSFLSRIQSIDPIHQLVAFKCVALAVLPPSVMVIFTPGIADSVCLWWKSKALLMMIIIMTIPTLVSFPSATLYSDLSKSIKYNEHHYSLCVAFHWFPISL